MSGKHPLMILLLLLYSPVLAQQPGSSYGNFGEFLEKIMEREGSGEADEAFLEELQELHQNPVMINTAGPEDLLKIPFLNEVTVSFILEYRRRYGKFYSAFELASVPGLDRDLAEKISWFISAGAGDILQVPDTLTRKRGIHQILNRTNITFPFPDGYRSNGGKPPAYIGNPLAIQTKYKFEKRDKLDIGFTADKDPGEAFFKDPNPAGFDFYSGHASLAMKGIIRKITVGDYTVRTGQGLVCWQGFSMGKSSEVMQASRNMSQIKPYSSTDENQFFRGTALSFRFQNVTAHLFLSSKKSDGNLSVDDQGIPKITSLQTSGYHRTVSETADEKNFRHTVAGAILTLHHRQVKAGFTGLMEKFGHPYDPGEQLYEKYYFRGRYNGNLSADYHWITGKYHLFGEAALSLTGSTAFIQGIEAELHDQLKATFLFRHYGKKYHATWASAFGAGSLTNNETGWYAGIRFLPAPGIGISAYADWFFFPWIKYNTASPARGSDIMLQSDISINRRFTGYLRYKSGIRQNKTTGGHIYGNQNENKRNLRIHCKFDIRNIFSFTWRMELSNLGKDIPGTGFLCYQDMAFTPASYPVSTVLRISWFMIPTWDSRIYAYENDLLYAFSTLSFFGNGFRTYLKIKTELTHSMELWFKAGCSCYPGQEKKGSGNSATAGNIITDVKFQVRYRF